MGPENTSADRRLEWAGNRLYTWRGEKMAYIGMISPDPFGRGRWDVVIDGDRKHNLSDEASARRQLEEYA